MECDPLAQAALREKFTPVSLKMVDRFIVTVEFSTWNTDPEPTIMVSFFSRTMSKPSITGFAQLSFP
ncbi:hypothetical protein D9M68_942620 [compost metagenome]